MPKSASSEVTRDRHDDGVPTRMTDQDPIDETTARSRRSRASDAQHFDQTAASSLRAPRVPESDQTVVSERRVNQPLPDGDHTVVSARRVDSPLPDGDQTVASTTSAPRVAPAEETILRSVATRAGNEVATDEPEGEPDPRHRTAVVPDADALRDPIPPRPAPLAVTRAPRVEPSSVSPAPADRESVERHNRSRARRRLVAIVVSASVVLVAAIVTLVLLLT